MKIILKENGWTVTNRFPEKMNKKPCFAAKPHYDILDGLRGVAALVVIAYHVFECFDWTPLPHGYLAVDFFFVLSGFVIGYAYDDRWQKGLSIGGFFRRRLIRLHPMVVLGALIGMVCFLMQGSMTWNGNHIPFRLVIVALLFNMCMLPMSVGARADVRGNGELFPLNGPHWSLFFEYVGNVLYALLLRRLPDKALAAVSVGTGCLLVGISVSDGYLGTGWTMVDGGFFTGMVRMLFPYSMGMLMARRFRAGRIKKAFWKCSAVLVAVACVTLLFTQLPSWANGLYDALCVVIVFPALVWMGASASDTSSVTENVSRFLGNLSYPLYAVHYPLMYLFYAYIGFDGNLVPIARMHSVWPVALLLPLACVLLGWMAMRFYDIPVRKWLSKAGH